jgi:hypothetical protein
MNKLMNSAMMPIEGRYSLYRASVDQFVYLLQNEPFESYIGYQSTADFLKRLSGIDIPVNRDQTRVEDGDKLLIIRLKYRLADPADKRDKNRIPADEDYEFFICLYGDE